MIAPHMVRAGGRLQMASVVTAVFVLSAGCSASDRKAADTQSSAAPTAASGTAARFTAADFAHLRWLAGDWRGRLANGNPFYESYRVIDDSTIHGGGFSDATFKTQKDTTVITLRGGVLVLKGSGSPQIATRADTNAVDFASERVPPNHFTWTRVSADRWRADIFIASQSGVEPKIVYQMERVKRK